MLELLTSPETVGSAIGAIIAILGAIIIFFLKKWWEKRVSIDEIRKNSIKELEYNKDMILAAQESIDRMIEEISVGQSNIFFTHNSSNILLRSVQAAYEQGILDDRLTSQQIATLNSDALTFFGTNNVPIENFVGQKVEEWKSGLIEQDDLYGTCVWVRDKAKTAIAIIDESIELLGKKER